MELFTAAAMREADEKTSAQPGMSTLRLMRRAAEALARHAADCCGETRRAAFFCSTGNNGGDGLGAALLLHRAGFETDVFLLNDPSFCTPDSSQMLSELRAEGVRPDVGLPADAEERCLKCGVLVDAIFGFGLSRPVSGLALEAVRLMNRLPVPVVSADLPSGVECDTGRILGDAVKADHTVSFTASKPGHWILPGALCRGELAVEDIGVDPRFLRAREPGIFLTRSEDCVLPTRPRDAHKGSFGRALLLAGCVGYTGAPDLAASAALRVGAGLVSLYVPDTVYPILAAKQREATVFPIASTSGGAAAAAAYEGLREKIRDATALLIGPGLGRDPESLELARKLALSAECPVILDADGLNAFAGNPSELKKMRTAPILTPHDGEFARLGGDLSAGRLAAARYFAREYSVILVLKGHRTLTVSPSGEVWVNSSGNPGMAKGGSGDVLAGMITGLCAQRFDPLFSARCGVWLHGAAGDAAAERLGEYSVLAGDLLTEIGPVIKQCLKPFQVR